MNQRDGFPAGVPAWIDTNQPDPEAAASFYSALFGWQFEDRSDGGSDLPYLVASLDIAPVRSAAIRDPAGARFTVSAFNAG